MEFLDINYSEVNEVTADNTLVLNMLNFFIDAGITSKEPVDGMALAAELDQPTQELIQVIIGTKTDPQEKAIVTALINKYKNLDSDKRDIEEFKEHTKNMIESNALGYGSLNYLLERVTSGDVKEKGTKQPETQTPPPVQQEPEGQQAQQEQEQSEPQQGPADTNNSDIMSDKLMEDWDKHFSEETELTEDDFADILGDSLESLVSSDNEIINAENSTSSMRSSEEIKKEEIKPNKAKAFAKAKREGKEVKYSEEDGFTRAATFLILKEAEYTNLPSVKESMDEVTNLDSSDENKVELSKIKARKFLARKDKAFHGGMSLVHPSISVSDSEGPNSIQSGSTRIKLESKKDDRDHDGEQDYKLDIRGNLETTDLGDPITVARKKGKKF